MVYKGDGRIGKGCDGVMSIPWVLGLVPSRTPVVVEEQKALGGNLPTCQ